MVFKMTYEERNLANIEKLAENTKKAALEWYHFCEQQEIDILIYETKRTLEEQAKYFATGASQTMRSYHLVGQAFDFAPVKDRKIVWNDFETESIKMTIQKAKELGFVWGGDWKTLVDKVHLQYNYKGYGTDYYIVTEAAVSPVGASLVENTGNDTIKSIQKELNSRYDIGLNTDGIFGPITKQALIKGYQKELNKQFKAGLMVNGIWGSKTKEAGKTVKKGAKGNLTYLIQSTVYMLGYDPKGIDSIFGAGTEKAVKAFQKSKKILQDGIVGKNTWEQLFK